MQKIEFAPLANSSLQVLLGLPRPVFLKDDPYRQLTYLEEYLRDPKIGCDSVLIEHHYIDRDYMEDHSVFYSKSLAALPNHCKRLHFFKGAPEQVEQELNSLYKISETQAFRQASKIFSEKAYLGFSVIKPLNGCPVGRTVVKCFPAQAESAVRNFDCACDYSVHLLGVPLYIRGLAFQQQDLGVSACATTALWSALQRTREMEEGTPATPAQITMRASHANLPFGRPMPSEGLSVGQMCQAVYSFGYSPTLIRGTDFRNARAVLYSAVHSGVSPVLIMKSVRTQDAHAVAVSGMKLKRQSGECLVEGFDDAAADLLALYIHDDRIGPYVSAAVHERASQFELNLDLRKRGQETWQLLYILIPMHNKVRLSFTEVRKSMIRLASKFSTAVSLLNLRVNPLIASSRIIKSYAYVETKIAGQGRLPYPSIETLTRRIPFPRYVGVISLESDWLGHLDLLIDSTSTDRNIHYLAVVHTPGTETASREIAKYLAAEYGCPLV